MLDLSSSGCDPLQKSSSDDPMTAWRAIKKDQSMIPCPAALISCAGSLRCRTSTTPNPRSGPAPRRAEFLRLHGWINTGKTGQAGYFVLDRHAIVTFAISGIMGLQLAGFSIQNVIGGLVLRRAPDRRGCFALDPLPQDVEIELEPCYGLDGLIRARAVSISFQPGKPNAQDG
jgi:hypothetical protein